MDRLENPRLPVVLYDGRLEERTGVTVEVTGWEETGKDILDRDYWKSATVKTSKIVVDFFFSTKAQRDRLY